MPSVAHPNGLMFNGSSALGAWALGGPMWAGITFLAVALVRALLDAHALREERALLRHRLLAHEGFFVDRACASYTQSSA